MSPTMPGAGRQSPESTGFPDALRGVEADRSGLPSAVRGMPAVGCFSHWAESEMSNTNEATTTNQRTLMPSSHSAH